MHIWRIPILLFTQRDEEEEAPHPPPLHRSTPLEASTHYCWSMVVSQLTHLFNKHYIYIHSLFTFLYNSFISIHTLFFFSIILLHHKQTWMKKTKCLTTWSNYGLGMDASQTLSLSILTTLVHMSNIINLLKAKGKVQCNDNIY